MPNCTICNKDICNHGFFRIKDGKAYCFYCKSTDLSLYCLPMYEGKVDFSSDVFSHVCKECHEKACNDQNVPFPR
jgi:hypothetical protein